MFRGFTALFTFFSVLLFSQKEEKLTDESFFKVRYKVEFLSDTIKPNSNREDVMTLLIGKNSSRYFSEQKYISDSIRNTNVKNSIAEAKKTGSNITIDLSSVPKYYTAHEIYKKDSIVIYNRIGGNYFSFLLNKKIIWKLKSETKNIEGHLCNLAIGEYNGRMYDVWYAPDIQVSEGPYVFKGLPGLVFSVSDSLKYYSFNLISLEKRIVPIVPISSAVRTTREKFRTARQAYINTSPQRLAGSIHRDLSDVEKEKINQSSKNAPNNYLD